MFLVLGCPDQFLSKLISFISLQYAVFKVRVGLSRLELPTSRLSGVRSNLLSYKPLLYGDEETRTLDPLLARQVLSQLSYVPIRGCWRPPALPHRLQCSTIGRTGLNRRVRNGNGCDPCAHRHQQGFVAPWQLNSKTYPLLILP